MQLKANIVDVFNRKIFPGELTVEGSQIVSIRETQDSVHGYILPGLVDAHVHVESSMTVPSRFAPMVVPRGTVAVVSDPHEIANVLGRAGVEYMIEDSQNSPLKCFFGVPSCVPATDFESSGGQIETSDVAYLFEKGALFLAEMMNFPGVIHGSPEVKAMLELARRYGRPVDGHAPGLSGRDLEIYCKAGISTDHECSTLEEAIAKIEQGMSIQIREGSAARNFEALHSLMASHPEKVMLCTDDSHPDLILRDGHIDRLVRLALGKGYSIFEIYQAALINPVRHYHLSVGMLREGDVADFIRVDNLQDFKVTATYIEGVKVAEDGEYLSELPAVSCLNNFNCSPIVEGDIEVLNRGGSQLKVIEAEDGELLTGAFLWDTGLADGVPVEADTGVDILKIVVLNRYKKAKPVVGFIRGFGLQGGAIAGSVAHDSHNIVALGCDDTSIVNAINTIIGMQGGLVACKGSLKKTLALPVAGLMSDQKGEAVAREYEALNAFVFDLGVRLKAPFMTLAFMPLLVIPQLKIGDRGLFDVTTFSFTDLFVANG